MSREYTYKIILIGPGAVGKTSLVDRFINNKFSTSYKMTMGVDILNKDLKVNGSSVSLSLWDLGGQERFRFMRKNFYRGASGALLIFDLTREFTYQQIIGKWFPEMIQFTLKPIPFMLIGNKIDLVEELGRVVERETAKHFADENNSIYIETSAKTGENVEEAFTELTTRIMKRTREIENQ